VGAAMPRLWRLSGLQAVSYLALGERNPAMYRKLSKPERRIAKRLYPQRLAAETFGSEGSCERLREAARGAFPGATILRPLGVERDHPRKQAHRRPVSTTCGIETNPHSTRPKREPDAVSNPNLWPFGRTWQRGTTPGCRPTELASTCSVSEDPGRPLEGWQSAIEAFSCVPSGRRRHGERPVSS